MDIPLILVLVIIGIFFFLGWQRHVSSDITGRLISEKRFEDVISFCKSKNKLSIIDSINLTAAYEGIGDIDKARDTISSIKLDKNTSKKLRIIIEEWKVKLSVA